MSNNKFNVNTSGLSDFVYESKTELLYQLQMDSALAPYSAVEVGVKDSRRLHFISTSVTFQTDACSYNASDATPLTEKTLTVAPIAVMEDICVKSLNGFWAEQLVKKGAKGEEAIPAEISRAWMDKKFNLMQRAINTADWQGDTDSGTANLNKYDGLIKQIFADASTIDGNTEDETSVTLSNILAVMQDMYLAIPEDLRSGAPDGGNLKWFLPQAWLDLYIIAGRNANLFHWDIKEGFGTYHGTNIELVPQVGLAGTDKMFIIPTENIVIGMDGDTEEDNIDVWYSKDDRINHSLIAFKRGITYRWSNYIVRFGLGAS